MKLIQLTQGQTTKVSDVRFEELNKNKWYASWSPRTNSFYAMRKHGNKTIYMHREIMKPADGLLCDHKNHDTLDNQDENLRICTHSQNCKNRIKKAGTGTSRYKGVFKTQYGWDTSVCKEGVVVYAKMFKSEEAAARAYDKVSLEHFGEFAVLNFPESKEA